MFRASGETIEHITTGCSALSNEVYFGRHNQAAKVIHQELALKYKLAYNPPPYYKHTPVPIMENNEYIHYTGTDS